MKKIILLSLAWLAQMLCMAQEPSNIIVVTLDGMRWQEIFNGADSTLLNNSAFRSKDSLLMYKKFYSENREERRKQLMPFLWNSVVPNGLILGNRSYNNKVDVKNKYWFSYPGYNEIFTGYPDTLVNSNEYIPNPNQNVLSFLNITSAYKNKVAVFASWNAFRRIFNSAKSGLPVFDGFADVTNVKDPKMELLNSIQDLLPDLYDGAERLDAVTGLMAIEYIKSKHPRIIYVSLGETDEWAHAGKYDFYLEAARYNDELIKMIWETVQSDPFYKNKTTLLITTDHGRGLAEKWTSHNNSIPNSNEIWIAAMGNKIARFGEVKKPMQLYQQQLAQTISFLAGLKFTADHVIAPKIDLLFDQK